MASTEPSSLVLGPESTSIGSAPVCAYHLKRKEDAENALYVLVNPRRSVSREYVFVIVFVPRLLRDNSQDLRCTYVQGANNVIIRRIPDTFKRTTDYKRKKERHRNIAGKSFSVLINE